MTSTRYSFICRSYLHAFTIQSIYRRTYFPNMFIRIRLSTKPTQSYGTVEIFSDENKWKIQQNMIYISDIHII